MTLTSKQVRNEWKPILEAKSAPEIKSAHKEWVTAQILENSRREGALRPLDGMLTEAAHTNAATSLGGADSGVGSAAPASGAVHGYDPIVVSLLRRTMPNLMAYDVCGVQPLTGPTGLIFSLRSKFQNQSGAEALFNTSHSHFAGLSSSAGQTESDDPTLLVSSSANSAWTVFPGMPRSTGEALGDGVGQAFQEMAFTIDKTAVEAKTRALKAEYTVELQQDLKAVHGLDAESELANILSSEILFEINREIIRTIYYSAKVGAQSGTTSAGIFDLDTDSNGRWSVEKFKGLLFQIEREANVIAKDTRRGRGNFIICTSDVASALSMAGVLDYAPALSTNLNVDDTGNTFVGTLNGKFKVYVDPYSNISGTGKDFFLVGYKGSTAWDAGLFYCPYVPLQMFRAVDQNTMQPKIAYKTRYGLVLNPFVINSSTNVPYQNPQAANARGVNQYFRLCRCDNIL